MHWWSIILIHRFLLDFIHAHKHSHINSFLDYFTWLGNSITIYYTTKRVSSSWDDENGDDDDLLCPCVQVIKSERRSELIKREKKYRLHRDPFFSVIQVIRMLDLLALRIASLAWHYGSSSLQTVMMIWS